MIEQRKYLKIKTELKSSVDDFCLEEEIKDNNDTVITNSNLEANLKTSNKRMLAADVNYEELKATSLSEKVVAPCGIKMIKCNGMMVHEGHQMAAAHGDDEDSPVSTQSSHPTPNMQ